MNKVETSFLKPHLIAISVANVDQTATWYEQILGFTIFKKMDLPEYQLRIIMLEYDGFQIELIEKQNSAGIKAHAPDIEDDIFVQGYKKLAFLVTDVDKLAAKLKNAGVDFLYDVTEQLDDDFPGGRTKFFIVQDPDGNWVQFFQKFI